MDTAQYIVELRLPSGVPFRRSAPMSQVEAEAVAKKFNSFEGVSFTAGVVPAEKYAGVASVPANLERVVPTTRREELDREWEEQSRSGVR